MQTNKWPKVIEPFTEEQKKIGDDFMKHWLEVLSTDSWKYRLVENFNHGYSVKHAPKNFVSTLEIGAGVGGHLQYEKLNQKQQENYIALDIRENVVGKFKESYPHIKMDLADCQKTLPYPDGHFDRILAIHVLEHLPNLPSALKEMHRLCNKERGVFSVVIPCEGGMLYSLARKISTERIFAKRYHSKFKWFIEKEHINMPHEVIEEIKKYFLIEHQSYFPFMIPIVHFNLCIGLTLRAK
jgi:ubiquinone/menaquinone biosynthesis C-methylase UbiE